MIYYELFLPLFATCVLSSKWKHCFALCAVTGASACQRRRVHKGLGEVGEPIQTYILACRKYRNLPATCHMPLAALLVSCCYWHIGSVCERERERKRATNYRCATTFNPYPNADSTLAPTLSLCLPVLCPFSLSLCLSLLLFFFRCPKQLYRYAANK